MILTPQLLLVKTPQLRTKLTELCHRLIDQNAARVIVEPYADSSGYWFGGGNLMTGPDGNLYLVGRYRNEGDSRTGLAAGSRGLELAIFRSTDGGKSFEKMLSLSKEDLNVGDHQVLSIEGTALRSGDQGIELFVSTEKSGVAYPPGLEPYLKPGTGIWSIDQLHSVTVEGLKDSQVRPLFAAQDPAVIHVKDPFLFESDRGPLLFFCSHPFSWTCSNTGYFSLTEPGEDSSRRAEAATFDFFPRGFTWDVAISRGTCIVPVPQLGVFAEKNVQLMFYDGGECVRDHQQHAKAVTRPRGHSCEELGGAAVITDECWEDTEKLSIYEPMFVSPWGTGCSRYVDVLSRPEGMYATWQQSQQDGSQPLVMNFVPTEEIAQVLA